MKSSTLIAVLPRLTTAMAAVAPVVIFGFLYVLAIEPQRESARAAVQQLAEATSELGRQRLLVRRAPSVVPFSAASQFDSRTIDADRIGEVVEPLAHRTATVQPTRSTQAAPAPAPPLPLSERRRERLVSVQPDPVVSSILFSSGRRVALIDGRIVRVGDRVGSAIVRSIEPSAVVIATADGQQRRLELERPTIRPARR